MIERGRFFWFLFGSASSAGGWLNCDNVVSSVFDFDRSE
jgi:hypothetical protein